MRRILAIVLMLFVMPLAYAQTVLIQLGVKGVTATGGSTNVANYLVKTSPTGQIDPSLLPFATNVTFAQASLYYVDPNGTDGAKRGAIGSPFKSLTAAMQAVASNKDVAAAIILSPGSYTMTNYVMTSTNLTSLSLYGYDATCTSVDPGTPIELNTTKPVTVRLHNVTVGSIRQNSVNQPLTVEMYAKAGLQSAWTFAGFVVYVYYDPTSTPPTPTASITPISSLTAAYVSYVATDTNAWGTNSITTVQNALDILRADQPAPTMLGTNIGQMLYWNGIKWALIHTNVAGTVLLGGATPVFGYPTLLGAITGSMTNTVIAAGVITATNIGTNAIGYYNLPTNVNTNLAHSLMTYTAFGGGDIVGTGTNLTNRALAGLTLPTVTSGMDGWMLIYSNAGLAYALRPVPDPTTNGNVMTVSHYGWPSTGIVAKAAVASNALNIAGLFVSTPTLAGSVLSYNGSMLIWNPSVGDMRTSVYDTNTAGYVDLSARALTAVQATNWLGSNALFTLVYNIGTVATQALTAGQMSITNAVLVSGSNSGVSVTGHTLTITNGPGGSGSGTLTGITIGSTTYNGPVVTLGSAALLSSNLLVTTNVLWQTVLDGIQVKPDGANVTMTIKTNWAGINGTLALGGSGADYYNGNPVVSISTNGVVVQSNSLTVLNTGSRSVFINTNGIAINNGALTITNVGGWMGRWDIDGLAVHGYSISLTNSTTPVFSVTPVGLTLNNGVVAMTNSGRVVLYGTNGWLQLGNLYSDYNSYTFSNSVGNRLATLDITGLTINTGSLTLAAGSLNINGVSIGNGAVILSNGVLNVLNGGLTVRTNGVNILTVDTNGLTILSGRIVMNPFGTVYGVTNIDNGGMHIDLSGGALAVRNGPIRATYFSGMDNVPINITNGQLFSATATNTQPNAILNMGALDLRYKGSVDGFAWTNIVFGGLSSSTGAYPHPFRAYGVNGGDFNITLFECSNDFIAANPTNVIYKLWQNEIVHLPLNIPSSTVYPFSQTYSITAIGSWVPAVNGSTLNTVSTNWGDIFGLSNAIRYVTLAASMYGDGGFPTATGSAVIVTSPQTNYMAPAYSLIVLQDTNTANTVSAPWSANMVDAKNGYFIESFGTTANPLAGYAVGTGLPDTMSGVYAVPSMGQSELVVFNDTPGPGNTLQNIYGVIRILKNGTGMAPTNLFNGTGSYPVNPPTGTPMGSP